jgi:hypothetical protein
LLVHAFELHPLYTVPAGSLSAAVTARLIGASAIRFYSESRDQAFIAASTAPA